MWTLRSAIGNIASRRLCTSAAKKTRVGEYAVRIENKIGVGLRYRRPRVWDGTKKANTYSGDDVAKWRTEFRLPFRPHSSGSSGSYTDEELLAWRAQFDEYALNEVITLTNFHKLVQLKCEEIPPEQLPSRVMEIWKDFDEDQNNSVDFGEFMKAGLSFDIQYLKEKIAKQGPTEVFNQFQDDGFISEPGLFSLMQEFKFFVTTTSDMRKLLTIMDTDKNGLVSKQELIDFCSTEILVESVVKTMLNRSLED